MTAFAADRERLVDELTALVAIPSVTGSETEIQLDLARRLSGMGLTVDSRSVDHAALAADPDFPGCEVERTELRLVAGTLGSGRPGTRVLLVAHVDVVPPGDPASWTTPAFDPDVRDGSVYGRGACDMKGGLVACLEALRLTMAEGYPRTGQIVLALVPSEEDGGAGSLAAIRAGYTGDVCVIPEPTALEIVVAHAGAITFTLDVPGRAAHASTRREGVSALDKLAYLVAALEEDEQSRNASERDPRMVALGLPYPTIIGQVSGGSWPSTVMDRVVAHGRYGVKLGQTGDEAAAELTAAVTAAWNSDPWLVRHPVGVRVWGGRFDSASVPDDHPLPRSLAAAHRGVTGAEASLVGAPYGADMRLFINQGATPTVMYGPGDVRVAHSADEHVSVDEMATCAEVLATWMAALTG